MQGFSRSLSVLLAFVALTGCYNGHTVLVMPNHYNANGTVPVYRCAHSGWGYIGAPMASHAQKVCIEDAKAMGYTEELKPEQATTKPATPEQAACLHECTTPVLKAFNATEEMAVCTQACTAFPIPGDPRRVACLKPCLEPILAKHPGLDAAFRACGDSCKGPMKG